MNYSIIKKIFKKFFLIIFFFTGCTYVYNVKSNFEVPSSTATKIPMRVGLHLSTDMKQYKFNKNKDGEKHIYDFGESVCNGIERMLEEVFMNVVTVESIDSTVYKKYGIKAVVDPQIESSNVLFATKLQPLEILIRIKYTVYDVNRNILWIDTFEGEGQKKWDSGMGWVWIFPPAAFFIVPAKTKKDTQKCIQIALEDHFEKALDGMLMSKWWESVK